MKLIGISSLILVITIFTLFFHSSISQFKKTYENPNQTLGVSITENDSLSSFNITPSGPINPGDSYEITVSAKNTSGEICKHCGIKVYFKEPQPGDEIFPNQGRLDDQGQFYIKATSYMTQDRPLFFDVRTSEDNLNSSSVTLQYNNNPLLSIVRLITSTISKVGSLPPMGNIYAKATKQRSLEGGKREIDLSWNWPFGTRRVDIYSYFQGWDEDRQLVKSAQEDQSSIIVDANKDVHIHVQACTVKESCVDGLPLLVPKLESSQSGELDIPNFGYSYGDIESLEQKDAEGFNLPGPFKNWLSGLYSSFQE